MESQNFYDSEAAVAMAKAYENGSQAKFSGMLLLIVLLICLFDL